MTGGSAARSALGTVVLVAGLVACGSDDGREPIAVVTNPTTTVAATAPAGVDVSDPQAVANALWDSWAARDRAASEGLAGADAVDALYARQYNPADEWTTPTQCAGTGPVICIWTSPTQELRVQLDQSPAGWKVSKAVFADR
jgi:hypothetical protein